MNSHRDEHESRLQALAEQAERAGLAASGDPQLDRYRLVARALRQPLMHALPVDFAARVLLRIAHAEERAGLEDSLATGLMLVLAVVGLVVVQPFVGVVVTQFHMSLPELPWPLLLGSALSIGTAFLVERLWSRAHPAAA